MFIYVPYYALGKKKVQWSFFASPLANLRGTDPNLMRMQAVQSQVGDVGFGRVGVPGAVQVGEFNQFTKFFHAAPASELGDLVFADDPNQGGCGVDFPELAGRIESVANPAPFYLGFQDIESRILADRDADHTQAIFVRGPDRVGPEGCLSARDEREVRERQLFKGVLGRNKMAVVNGIETPTKKSQLQALLHP